MSTVAEIEQELELPAKDEVLAHSQSEAEKHLRTTVRFVLIRMSPQDIVRIVTDEAGS